MGNIGMAVSQPKYDVKDSADRFKVFSSSFQTLKIFNTYSVSTTIPTAGNVNTITITHSLGHFAPFFVVYNGSTSIGVADSYYMADKTNYPIYDNDSYSGLRMYENTLEIKVDEYFDESYSSAGDTVYFTVYIFLDDFRTVAENTINSGTSSGASSTDYGERCSKAGYDVKTCTDEQCTLSSSFFNAIVHKKGIQVYTAGYTVSHNLGYVPGYLAFVKESGASYITANPYSQYISATNLTYDSSEVTGATFYYIIFKDKVI